MCRSIFSTSFSNNSNIIHTYIIIIIKETKKVHISTPPTKLFHIFPPDNTRDGTRDKGNPQTSGSHRNVCLADTPVVRCRRYLGTWGIVFWTS